MNRKTKSTNLINGKQSVDIKLINGNLIIIIVGFTLWSVFCNFIWLLFGRVSVRHPHRCLICQQLGGGRVGGGWWKKYVSLLLDYNAIVSHKIYGFFLIIFRYLRAMQNFTFTLYCYRWCSTRYDGTKRFLLPSSLLLFECIFCTPFTCCYSRH